MMKRILGSISLLLTLLLYGCAYPNAAQMEQKDNRPTLGITNAPKHSVLYVNGLEMGPAGAYNGKSKVLLLESGTNVVEIKSSSGEVLHTETLFLSSSTHKIIDL